MKRPDPAFHRIAIASGCVHDMHRVDDAEKYSSMRLHAASRARSVVTGGGARRPLDVVACGAGKPV
jgi:hypothetical protein